MLIDALQVASSNPATRYNSPIRSPELDRCVEFGSSVAYLNSLFRKAVQKIGCEKVVSAVKMIDDRIHVNTVCSLFLVEC